jgi:outer membrane protein assembly factor BamB
MSITWIAFAIVLIIGSSKSSSSTAANGLIESSNSPTHIKKEVKMDDESPRRMAPKKVAPLSVNGVRYEVTLRGRSRGFTQPGGVIVAIDEKTGKEIWILQAYTVTYERDEEQDVQNVFITEIALSGNGKALLITNERGERYSVNLEDRSILKFDD